MVDFTSSNLQGANAQFNSIVSKLNDTKSSALANLQADASAAAEAIGSEWRNQKAGSIGEFGTFSFHGTKTISTGEGGMFVTNNDELYRLP